LLAAAAVFVLVFFIHGATRSPGLSAEKTARALERKVDATTRYTCHRIENDGTITLRGVDYRCDPTDPQATGYWVAVNAHRITGTQPMG
jgi:23S rRNA G2069 N7-methylase RlmK/C1962 C5-methylase RlmI